MAIKFIPVKGKEQEILSADLMEGAVYVSTDTGTIYADLNGRRMSIGGSGSGGGGNGNIIFAKADAINEHEDKFYHINFSDIENNTMSTIPVDAIVINKDGAFYRVRKFENDILYCDQIAVSGGGGGSAAEKIYVDLAKAINTTNYINGEAAYATITPHSGKNQAGQTLDDTLTVTWSLHTKSGSNYIQYYKDTVDVADGTPYTVNFGKQAKQSETSYLFVEASGINSGVSTSKNFSFNMVALTMEAASTFSNSSPYSYDNVVASVNVVGDLDKIIEYYLDDELIHTEEVGPTFTNPRSCKYNSYVDSISHGYHTLEVKLYQSIQGEKGIAAQPIKMEIAVDAGGTDPIIWFGDYPKSYFSYDDISIPYYVYNPANKSAFSVELLKDNAKIGTRDFENLSDGLISANYEITDADAPEGSSKVPVQNNYAIACGESKREIIFEVAKDPDRDMSLQKSLYLAFNFDAKGRSNDQSATQRTTLDVNGTNAIFSDFNWYNNGWVADENGKTCLRISNGASLTLPIGKMGFGNASDQNQQSHTFEFQFKIRNVQTYDSLISNITRYQNDGQYYDEFYGYLSWKEDVTNQYNINNDYFIYNAEKEAYEDAGINNEAQYLAVKGQHTVYIGTAGYKTSYTNYDAFLKYYADLNGLSYDAITEKFLQVEKRFNLSAVACGFYSGKDTAPIGFGLGPQDAFFTNGTNTVNANYVEDEMVNVSIVYNHNNKLMSIYVNGILTGVVFSSLDDVFTINNNNIVFNSTYCDIDLYKFRIYNTALSLNDIGTNYAVDLKDIKVYDQNALANENNTINEYEFNFQNMLAYNKSHPEEPVMPYIIYDTSENEDDRLSWSKKTKLNIKVEFVNTVLDSAYQLGELDDLADKMTTKQKDAAKAAKMSNVEYYYAHHCPSWKGDIVEMAVQGTSSEFYPRRNYKLKTKDKDGNINMNMHKGPFADKVTNTKWFYMDNYDVGTTKFTMKIDYMESSGSYNRGLGNLLGNAYTQHPLDYYAKANALSKGTDKYDPYTGEFDDSKKYFYYNHKGNIKAADGTEDNIPTLTAEMFAKGPVAVYEDLMAADSETYTSKKVVTDTSSPYYNKWYTGGTVYNISQDFDFSSLRTNTQGIPVLAFHKKKDGTYKYIGRYNMLLDKGSDECYGFKNDDAKLALFGNKDIKKYAECWEYENNSRGFCSFRDPLHRKFLSFNTGAYVDKQLAPGVVEDYEYRYHTYADQLDVLCGEKATNLDSLLPAQMEAIKAATKVDVSTTERAQDLLYDIYGNWEKACQWVWSTALDSVIYQITNDTTQRTDKFYYVLNNGSYSAIVNFVASETDLPSEPEIFTYYCVANRTKYTYDSEASAWNHEAFDCYEACPVLKQEDIDKLTAEEKLNYLLKDYVKVGTEDSLDSNKQYFKYVRHLYVPYVPTGETWEADVEAGLYSLETFTKHFSENSTEYIYDSYEYRYDKFKYELTDHFNFDYLATYFVVTEVLELYDSRGKNCMMASWGPMKEGGEYVWFPIFYDMDTQLGINNTGIPSFDYSINATDEGTFSTNDSILWNNFYKIFYNQIVNKYCQLRGQTEDIGDFKPLPYAPFSNVDRIEAWYESDPSYCGSIAMRGVRPLSAINLDEYYKYISITNPKVGYQDRDGGISYDIKDGSPLGTFFYALQGDRSLSRRQFLTNRINFVDSWMTVMSYARGGKNVVRGRITANNLAPAGSENDRKSDKWVENAAYPEYNSAYWKDEAKTTKNHEFDGEYWVTFTPSRKSYVTLGEDGQNYGSKKYSGTPVKFEITKLENGIRTSANYDEQLTYFYGTNLMQSYGNLNNLYFTELYFDSDADKLTDLILGWDGISADGPWYNKGTNKYAFSTMPLLKELNLSNIQYKSDVDHTLNFSGSQKLQNFRATGSNFTQIKFAEGVALNTLYLPSTITELRLTEAKQLKNVIINYRVPTLNPITNKLVADPGLYIQNFTDYLNDLDNPNMICNIETMNIINSENLGYDGYKLANGYFYKRNKDKNMSKFGMTNVLWTPYKLVDAGSVYNSSKHYYLDNFHCGLEPYTIDTEWENHIKNGMLYVLDDSIDANVIQNIELFENLAISSFFTDLTGDNIPNITGTVFVNNNEILHAITSGSVKDPKTNKTYSWSVGDEIDEYFVRNILGNLYPKVQFFFKTLTKNYTARFILLDEDNNKLFTTIGTQTIKSGWFENPIAIYGDISESKDNYDFYGWADKADAEENEVLINADGTVNRWDGKTVSEIDNVFYAIFSIHKYKITFVTELGPEDEVLNKVVVPTAYKTNPIAPKVLPYKDDSMEDREVRYRFTEQWMLNNNIIDLTTYKAIKDITLMPVFVKESVYASVTDEKYFGWADNVGSAKHLKPVATLKGKITIPNSLGGEPVKTIAASAFVTMNEITGVFFMDDNNLESIEMDAFNCNNSTNWGTNSRLKYFDFQKLTKLNVIGNSAFAYCKELEDADLSNTALTQIRGSGFDRSFNVLDNEIYVKLPSSINSINESAFNMAESGNKLNYYIYRFPEKGYTNVSVVREHIIPIKVQFGSEGNPCNIISVANKISNDKAFNAVGSITYYYDKTKFTDDDVISYLQNANISANITAIGTEDMK